jgi:hypothetical protein
MEPDGRGRGMVKSSLSVVPVRGKVVEGLDCPRFFDPPLWLLPFFPLPPLSPVPNHLTNSSLSISPLLLVANAA